MTINIGDVVNLRPYDDLKAIVRTILLTEKETRYECSWFDNNGCRNIEIFYPCELEKSHA